MGCVPHFINAREMFGRLWGAAVCLADGPDTVDGCESVDDDVEFGILGVVEKHAAEESGLNR